MHRYVFPAIFEPEDKGGYSIFFPDIEGCYSQGEDLADAVFMAEDALALMLTSMEDEGKSIPEPTPLDKVEHTPKQIVTLIYADTIRYRKLYNNKSVTCSITLPAWLKTMATERDINLSQTLQEALKAKLDIT
jgi:predicted RNase H-like HicB family nuclease